MTAHDRIEELIELAVLGEITPEQEAELDAALADDPELAADLDADLAVAATLQAGHAEAPPEQLKANVMAALDALDAADEPTVNEPAVNEPAVNEPGTEATENTPSDVVDMATARSERAGRQAAKRGPKWRPLAAAAAVAMLVIGGVVVAGRGGDDGPTFAAITGADDRQERSLDGDLDGRLDIVFSSSQEAFVLVGTDVPVLTEAETYQLWLIDDSGARPAGLFRPDARGRVEQIFEGLDPTDFVVGVTIEPVAGSDTPTLPIVASA